MSNAIIAGNPEPIAQPVETTWRKTGGSEFIHSWVGLESSCRAMESALRSTGAIEVRVSPRGDGSALAKIQAHYATPQDGQAEEIQETLSIDFVDETFPINVHPEFIEITDTRIQQLEKAAQDETVDITGGTYTSTEQYYMGLVRRKETSYRAMLPVLTYIRNVADNTAVRLDVEDIGKIYSKEDVAGFIAAPIIFAIPNANVGVVEGGHYQVGYRFACKMEFTSDGRINLIETYTYGRYEETLYGVTTIE